MAPSSSWKGYLKLSLVTCAVAMAPAITTRDKTRFNMLNRHTGNRLSMRMIDSVTEEIVERDDQVKGYEHAKGQYTQVEEEDFDAIALESKHTIEMTEFVDEDDLDTLYLGDSHYLMPDDEVAIEAFAVIREAMRSTKVAGVARVTVNKRERWVAVRPRGKGILLTTMRYPYEVRDERQVFDRIGDEKPDAKAVEAMEEIIDQMSGHWDTSWFNDRYEQALGKVLKAKQSGKTIKAAAPEKAKGESNVVNLMDTLRKAIEAEKRSKPAAKKKPSRSKRTAA